MEAFIADTLVCDSTMLNRFVTDDNYDYNSELQGKNNSLLDRVMQSISDWFKDLFGTAQDVQNSVMNNTSSTWVYILIAVLVIAILVLLYFMYKKKMFFFKRKNKDEEDYEVVEDSIYGVDFDKDIDAAFKAGNYKEAVRLTYLQCLRLLSDNELIDWRIYKTPTQYTSRTHNGE